MAFYENRPKPVKEGDVLDVRIDDIVENTGDGVAHVDKFVLFVREQRRGDIKSGHTVKVRIIQVRAHFAISEVFP